MLDVQMQEDGVAVVRPRGKLTRDDFAAIAAVVDPVIEREGLLHGLVIETEEFPGWEDFGALAAHLRFVREHQAKIDRVAIASDAAVASLLPKLAEHFVGAEIRHFSFKAATTARLWVAHKI